MTNERAERWLRSLGYEPEPEDSMDWIEVGRRPDFLCPGDRPFYAEIKTFDPPAEQQLMGRAYEDLRARCLQQDGLTGDLYVCIGTVYDQGVANWIMGHLRHGPRSQNGINIMAVPIGDANFGSIVRFEYESIDGRVFQSSPESESGKYPFYPGLDPQHWGARATMVRDSGHDEGPELYDLLESTDALISVALYPSNTPLTVNATIAPAMRGNRTDERIREAVKDANAQLRNAQRRRPAPGVCMIYHETLDFAGDMQVADALFGDLQIPVGGTVADAVFGGGGAWTAISVPAWS
jgi:hypothetical protein